MPLSKNYDVFISYAIEDKYPVAESIAMHLKQNGIKVCYVGSELKIGDLISTVISAGLRNSKYCIIILSPFYTRHWAVAELHRFIEKEELEKKILILPVWHNIDYEEAKQKYPMLADRYAMSTKEGLETVSASLCEVIRKKKKTDRLSSVKLVSVTAVFFLACATAIFFLCQKYFPPSTPVPARQFIIAAIQKRTSEFQSKLESDLQKKIATSKGQSVPLDSIINAYNTFINADKHERNEYRFSGESYAASGFKNIKNLGIFINEMPYNGYGIPSPDCYYFRQDSISKYSFALINAEQLSFTVDTLFESEGKVYVHVTYTQNIRSINGAFSYPVKPGSTKKQQIHVMGYKPADEYVFEIRDGAWKISEIK